MDARSGRDARSYDRRRWPRVPMSVPVHVSRTGDGGAVTQRQTQSVDLSTGGVYVMTEGDEAFAPGDILKVSVSVPWQARYLFPFSRIVGSCRVVRVDEVPESQGMRCGAALAFSEENVMRLGAIVFP